MTVLKFVLELINFMINLFDDDTNSVVINELIVTFFWFGEHLGWSVMTDVVPSFVRQLKFLLVNPRTMTEIAPARSISRRVMDQIAILVVALDPTEESRQLEITQLVNVERIRCEVPVNNVIFFMKLVDYPNELFQVPQQISFWNSIVLVIYPVGEFSSDVIFQ